MEPIKTDVKSHLSVAKDELKVAAESLVNDSKAQVSEAIDTTKDKIKDAITHVADKVHSDVTKSEILEK
jgi:gas vesicle protein